MKRIATIMLVFFLAICQAGACEKVVSSWYGSAHAGKKTASGEIFNPSKMTAAHRTLPFGTKLKVTYNGKSAVVKINDRGPYHGNRSLDVSEAAASKLGFKNSGTAKVCIERLN